MLGHHPLSTILLRGAAIVVAGWVSWQAIRGVIAGAAAVWHHVPLDELAHIVWLGVLTMSRVAAMHRFVKKTERDAERRAKEAQRQIEAMRERSNRVDGANVVALHSDRQSETD